MAFSHAAAVFYIYIPFIVWDIIVFGMYIRQLYVIHDRKSRKLSLLQQTLHNTCLVSIILTSIFDMLHSFGAMISNTELLGKNSIEWVTDMEILADVFYYTNSLLLYVILIHRLFSTFSNTTYAISKYFFYWISFQIIFQAIFMILYLLNLAIDNCRDTIWCERLGVTASLITGNDYILNIILFSLFIKKLRQLIVNKLQSEVSEWNNNKIDKALEDNANNHLLNVITKQTVIGTFITLTNQAFATCIFITFTFESAEEADSLVMIAYLLRGAEGAFICFLLYLGLGINKNQYNMVCKCCHKTCYNLCVKITAKNVNDSFHINDHYTELDDI